MTESTSPDDERQARRRASLIGALASLSDADRADVRVVAAVLVAPGFRRPDADAPGPLVADRAARADVMSAVLTAFPMILGTGGECAAAELTRPRTSLEHPMTGETMSLLDWVLRGGSAAAAIDALGDIKPVDAQSP